MPKVVLTFDDGPNGTTEWVLDRLAERNAKGIFFINGANAESEWGANIVRRAASEGHLIANHAYTHEHLPEKSDAEIEDLIRKSENVIRRVTGRSMSLMRPPYGETDARVEAVINRTGSRQMLWNVDSRDWAAAPDQEQYFRVIDGVLNLGDEDAIVLMHDGWTSRNHDWFSSVIDYLTAEGYTFDAWLPTIEWRGTYKLEIGWGGSSPGGVAWQPYATLNIDDKGVLRLDGEVIHNVSFDFAERLVSWQAGDTATGRNTTGGKLYFHRTIETMEEAYRTYFWPGIVPPTTFLVGSIQVGDWADLRGMRAFPPRA